MRPDPYVGPAKGAAVARAGGTKPVTRRDTFPRVIRHPSARAIAATAGAISSAA